MPVVIGLHEMADSRLAQGRARGVNASRSRWSIAVPIVVHGMWEPWSGTARRALGICASASAATSSRRGNAWSRKRLSGLARSARWLVRLTIGTLLAGADS